MVRFGSTEFIVRLQAMRGDLEVADARSVGQDHRHGRLGAAVAAPGFENVGNGAGAQGVPLQRDRDGGGQFLWAVVIEERLQPDQMGPEHLVPGGQAIEECDGQRHGQPQAIAATGRIGLSGGGEEPVEMGGGLDGLRRVVAADMTGDFVGPCDEADGRGAGEQRERPPDVCMRNLVVVAIEVDV
ncbi:MAG: hypothetical protein IMZ71_01980, partial [Chloroflexi bacterium]|nr:hypothetical protein [Chloroflexota bacterium]